MRILHVTMGNPSWKTGGLNRYCKDLAESQCLDGHDVFVLYPESFVESKKPHIITKTNNIYAIRDALPMAITYGIDMPERFMVTAQRNPYKSFLDALRPDVIHVHSIQGIHKEFFETAKKMQIPMLFTTHDYYPICLRCVLLNANGKICTSPGALACRICNQDAGLSVNKQRIVQSDLYQNIKNSSIVRKFKVRSAEKNQLKKASDKMRLVSEARVESCQEKSFKALLEYYSKIMHCMSFIHCNSSITWKQYKRYYSDIPMKVVPITHNGLLRSVHKRKNPYILNISYMGGMSNHKGYRILMNAVKKLNEQVTSGWKLWLYGGEYIQEYSDEKIQYKGFFTPDEESEVWANTDLLIVCSQCMETFGFIVLEALSRGIPVLCSDLVGSKDLVASICEQLVFQHSNIDELVNKIICFLNLSYYKDICKKIDTADLGIEMELHSRKITKIYRNIIYNL